MKWLALFLVACGSTPAVTHADNEAATLAGWCDEIGAAMCSALADRCFGGSRDVANGCRETFGPSCVAARPPEQPSGRNFGDAKLCIARIRQLSCEGLGAGIGSGELAALCAAR